MYIHTKFIDYIHDATHILGLLGLFTNPTNGIRHIPRTLSPYEIHQRCQLTNPTNGTDPNKIRKRY